MADVLIQTRINFGVKKWLKRPVNGEVTLHIFKMADDRGFDQKMAADCVYIICPQISMVISSIFMAKSRLIMYSCFINHMHLNVFRFVQWKVVFESAIVLTVDAHGRLGVVSRRHVYIRLDVYGHVEQGLLHAFVFTLRLSLCTYCMSFLLRDEDYQSTHELH